MTNIRRKLSQQIDADATRPKSEQMQTRTKKSLRHRKATTKDGFFFVLVCVFALLTHKQRPVLSNTKYLSEQMMPPPILDYGLELSYVLPLEILEEFAADRNRTRFKEILKTESFDKLAVALLEQGSIKAASLGHRQRAPQTWTISVEAASFEIASYLSPDPEEIRRLMEICNATHFQMDPQVTAFHVNIDARNRSMEEIRRVYMNYMAVEDAINTILTPHSSGHRASQKRSIAFGHQYESLAARYEGLNDRKVFPYPAWDRRTLKNGKVIQKKTSLVKQSDGSMSRKAARPKLCLTMDAETSTPRSFEFRSIESSPDPNVVLAWVQFARKLVAVSYAGRVLEPLERNPVQQWEVLFRTLIQDESLESILREWRDVMSVVDPDRESLVKPLCELTRAPIHACEKKDKKIRKAEKNKRRHLGGQ